MTGKDFVQLCHTEKENILDSYFEEDGESEAATMIKELVNAGVNKDYLYKLVNTVMADTYYTLLLGLDGACSLGDKQITYKLYDEEGKHLNPCGEIEENAYQYFMED